MKKNQLVAVFLIFYYSGCCFGESAGESLFKQNKSEEAVIFLEQEIENGTASLDAHNFLGLAYCQNGDFEKAVNAFERGLRTPGTNKKVLSYNQGNAFFMQKDYANAVKCYSLSLAADKTFYKAMLNRANAYLIQEGYENALKDYSNYILAVPDDPQKEEILDIIKVLTEEVDKLIEERRIAQEAEAEQKAEEERLNAAREQMYAEEQQSLLQMREEIERKSARQKEDAERRLAEEIEFEEKLRKIEEERKAMEAERRRRILEEVERSLQNTDSTSLTSGTEDLIEYDQESELE